MNRLEPLDWLRGLLAISIMLYHLAGWEFNHPNAGDILGRLGIYGVSMFFVLSGLSMAIGYDRYIQNVQTAQIFLIRRVFRIWPLLWVAVAAVTLGSLILKKETSVDLMIVLLNITTLFGFISPGAYINTGAWSIGNEMVYYVLTPVILTLYNRSRWIGNVFVLISFAVAVKFCFSILDSEKTLASQWSIYINPFNNLAFYCVGVAMYYNLNEVTPTRSVQLLLMIISISLFLIWPADGDLVSIVTGMNRIVFFITVTLMVWSFYKLTFQIHPMVSKSLASIGAATYGIYLLHPIIYSGVKIIFAKNESEIGGAWIIVMATVSITIILSILSFKYYERPFINWAKKITPVKIQNAK